MKKVSSLIFLILIAINSNTFSVNEEHDSKENAAQLSKKDLLKIGAASLGCAFSIYACLTSYSTYTAIHKKIKENRRFFKLPLHQIPAALMANILGIPVNIMAIFFKSFQFYDHDVKCLCHVCFGSGAIISAALAYQSGSYIHKKLVELKAKKQDPDSKKLYAN